MAGKWKYTDASCEVVTRQVDANTTESRAASALPQGTPIDAHDAAPEWSPQPLLTIVKAGREIALNRLNGVARRADKAGNPVLSDACDAAIVALLNITSLPAVLAATDDASFTAAIAQAYGAIVATADPEIVKAFRDIQS
jgi:hypothetical protein